MSISVFLAATALVAAVLLIRVRPAALPIVALVAAGLQVTTAFGWVRVNVGGAALPLVFAAALGVTGVLMYLRVGGKREVTAAALVTYIGIVQLLSVLRLF